MSDKIFLKDITLPIVETGEDETYSFVQTDSDLGTAGDAADAKKTGDEITQLKADLSEAQAALETKAEIDGSYDTMTVGNAKQLTSNVGINDKAPYLFRTAGGANDIGDREEDTIVGGSVVWNQLVDDSSAVTGERDGITASMSNHKYAITGTASANTGQFTVASNVSLTNGHKYFIAGITKYSSSPDGTVLRVYNSSEGVMWALSSVGDRIFQCGGATGLYRLYFFIYNGATVDIEITPQIIDLTAMFGTAIADYVYSLEQATAGAGVAWFRKLFPKDYYPYSEPTFRHVEGLASHMMTGFNQWDEEWEVGDIYSTNGANKNASDTIRSKNYIPVIPGVTYYFKSSSVAVKYYYDENKAFLGSSNWNPVNTTITFPNNVRYIRFRMNSAYGTTYKNDICLNIHWDGERDGEYEAYKEYNYPLDDSLTLRGIPKLDANNDLYYDGDTYEADGTVTRKYGIVDLGTLNWSTASGMHYAVVPDSKAYFDGLCVGYERVASTALVDGAKMWASNSGNWKNFWIKDTSKTSEEMKAAMSGVYLLYELATPTEETADPFQTPQVVDDCGTEEYVYADGAFSIPVGHDTFYAANLKAKLEMAPDSPGDGDGDYVVRQTNGLNEYVKMVKELPSAPTTDGSYHLEVTVASGTQTLTWVADE